MAEDWICPACGCKAEEGELVERAEAWEALAHKFEEQSLEAEARAERLEHELRHWKCKHEEATLAWLNDRTVPKPHEEKGKNADV